MKSLRASSPGSLIMLMLVPTSLVKSSRMTSGRTLCSTTWCVFYVRLYVLLLCIISEKIAECRIAGCERKHTRHQITLKQQCKHNNINICKHGINYILFCDKKGLLYSPTIPFIKADPYWMIVFSCCGNRIFLIVLFLFN